MTPTLSDLRACFEGVIPSAIATLGPDGMPNVSYLSQVFYVDDGHVALSNQFFSKTARNVRHTGRATALVVDGRTGVQHALELEFREALQAGDLFERMAAHLRALSSQHGLEDVMRLMSADVYRVTRIHAASAGGAGPTPSAEPDAGSPLAAAAAVVRLIDAAPDVDEMVDAALDGLAATLGFDHLMLLTPDPASGRLITLASRGYPTTGVGSEVELGQGVIGIAASERQPVRMCDMSRELRFARAVKDDAPAACDREIPLPGLPQSMSQVAVPMLARRRLQGVLFAEAAERFRFDWRHEEALMVVASHLAAQLRLAETDPDAGLATGREAAPPDAAAPVGPDFRVRFFPFDGSLFLDDAYLIKGVPGRLLYRFLSAYAAEGRLEFTNREVRLDPTLGLPGIKDNLETRLILLRRRLDERSAPVRLSRPERGRIQLVLSGRPRLEVVEAAD